MPIYTQARVGSGILFCLQQDKKGMIHIFAKFAKIVDAVSFAITSDELQKYKNESYDNFAPAILKQATLTKDLLLAIPNMIFFIICKNSLSVHFRITRLKLS